MVSIDVGWVGNLSAVIWVHNTGSLFHSYEVALYAHINEATEFIASAIASYTMVWSIRSQFIFTKSQNRSKGNLSFVKPVIDSA